MCFKCHKAYKRCFIAKLVLIICPPHLLRHVIFAGLGNCAASISGINGFLLPIHKRCFIAKFVLRICQPHLLRHVIFARFSNCAASISGIQIGLNGECNKWHPASAFSKFQVGCKMQKCRKCVANAFVHKSTEKSFCSGGYGLPVFYNKIKSVPRIGKFWNEKQYTNHCSGIHLYMYTCIHVCICIHVYVFWD